jgi:DNA helicase II / ATP-dependent DNA helicase PcrA
VGISTKAVLVEPRERVQALLDDEQRVSREKRAVVLADGDTFALACPGSGKTRVVGLRVAWASVDGAGRRIAATSYTNIAVEEIRRAAGEAGVAVGPEHFVGTLHSFLLRYVVYPFGHLEMGCDVSPRIVMETRQRAVEIDEVRVAAGAAGIPVWNFHFRADGTFSLDVPQTITLPEEEVMRRGADRARALKAELFRRGLMSPTDAMFVAARTVMDRPPIAQALANRFDEIIVDEVQDTSDLQFSCLDALKQNGLASVVVVGDVDQAIYGWMGATPEACEEFAARHSLAPLPLTRNFRSSQTICDTTVAFSSRDEPDTAAGPAAEFGVLPELFLYRPGAPTEAVDFFMMRVAELELDPARVAVLVRTIAFAARVNGTASANATRTVLALGEAASAYQDGRPLTRRAIQNLEESLAEMAWGEAALRSRTAEERSALRAQAMSLLDLLPALTGDLQAWIGGARSGVTAALSPLTAEPAIAPGRRVRALAGSATIDASTAFRASDDDPTRARTIHSAKGESHSATLLLGQRPAGGRDYPREWVTHLLGGDRNEETRVAYVAMTRPERYLSVALPTGTPDEVIDAFVSTGMTLLDSEVTGISVA